LTDVALSYFDVLGPDLAVFFRGINPCEQVAATGHNFGSPTNRFWRVLHLSGFTPETLRAGQDRQLLRFGCGITAVVSRATRSANDLRDMEFVAAEQDFRAKDRAIPSAQGRLSRKGRLQGDREDKCRRGSSVGPARFSSKGASRDSPPLTERRHGKLRGRSSHVA
jgi:Uracil DNA glycosylase superfamily